METVTPSLAPPLLVEIFSRVWCVFWNSDRVGEDNGGWVGYGQTVYGLDLFFELQIRITDGPPEYHRVTSGITRSYPTSLGNNVSPIQEKTQ
ncbi:hypothetical protein Hanom_Chr02g00165661 [Helianthus anomalus]